MIYTYSSVKIIYLHGNLVAQVWIRHPNPVPQVYLFLSSRDQVGLFDAALVDVAVEGRAVVIFVGHLDHDLYDLRVSPQLEDAASAFAKEQRVLGACFAVQWYLNKQDPFRMAP
jgi:hypothetical protein